MFVKALRLTVLLCCVFMAASALAQESHPAKGVWVGNWGATPTPQNRIVIVMGYDGKNITGVLNPGPNAAPLKVARMDITPGTSRRQGVEPVMPVFKMHIEADAKDAEGNPITVVADGTMNLVPLPNRNITGTWSQTSGGNTVRNNFEITRQQ